MLIPTKRTIRISSGYEPKPDLNHDERIVERRAPYGGIHQVTIGI